MIFKIYVAFSLFTFVFSLLVSIYVVRKFKRENPDVKPPRMPLFEKFMSWFRAILVSFIPILNVLIVICWLIAWDICVENAEDKLWDCIENNL